MMRWLLGTWLCIAVAIALTVWLLPGIDMDWEPFSYLVLAALWGVVNVSLGTLVRIISAPLLLVTLGLFSVVINTGILALVAQISDSLSVDGLLDALLAAIVISLVNAALMALWHRHEHQRKEQHGQHGGQPGAATPITPLG